jgi:hypothetical protein
MHIRSGHTLLALSMLLSSLAWGWGSTAHKIINKNAVAHLPPAMSFLAAQRSFLESHAGDADSRKSVDTAESPKHFIDIEVYPDNQHLPSSVTTMVMRYGWTTVKDVGILPWATVWTLDSLTAQLRRGDLAKAYQTAADLGHSVGDAHQPLHCTTNYDGYLTGNNGIHSRYESTMITQYQSMLAVVPDSARYVADPFAYVLGYILRSNALVDSILQADNAAKAASGWNGTGPAPQSYYVTLWERTRFFTSSLVQQSTVALASLWYTACVNSGGAMLLAVERSVTVPPMFVLEQNYPNPFNPITVISGQWPVVSDVRLVVYDLLGREVAVLVDGRKAAGRYEFRFDGASLSSGVYLCRLTAGEYVASRKMILSK